MYRRLFRPDIVLELAWRSGRRSATGTPWFHQHRGYDRDYRRCAPNGWYPEAWRARARRASVKVLHPAREICLHPAFLPPFWLARAHGDGRHGR
jgi:hypothetical protein